MLRVLILWILLIGGAVLAIKDSGLGWIGIARHWKFYDDIPDFNHKKTCNTLKKKNVLTASQEAYCMSVIDDSTELMTAVAQAARTTLNLCAQYFKRERWNCSVLNNIPLTGIPDQVQLVTKERGIIDTIASAALKWHFYKFCRNKKFVFHRKLWNKICPCPPYRLQRNYKCAVKDRAQYQWNKFLRKDISSRLRKRRTANWEESQKASDTLGIILSNYLTGTTRIYKTCKRKCPVKAKHGPCDVGDECIVEAIKQLVSENKLVLCEVPVFPNRRGGKRRRVICYDTYNKDGCNLTSDRRCSLKGDSQDIGSCTNLCCNRGNYTIIENGDKKHNCNPTKLDNAGRRRERRPERIRKRGRNKWRRWWIRRDDDV